MTRTKTIYILLLAAALAAPWAGAQTMTIEQAGRYLAPSFPNVRVEQVRPSPMPGVHEVVADGAIYYLTDDGVFLLAGVLYDLKTNVNLTERTTNELRRAAAARVRAEDTITYAPEKTLYTVTAFSDVNCPYCRKFHGQMERVHELGIRVQYLLIPLLGEDSLRKSVAVWCAEDRRAALDRAKSDAAVAQKDCDHPLSRNLRLAKTLGVHATPAFLLANGKLLNGYRTPDNLLEEIKRASAPDAAPVH